MRCAALHALLPITSYGCCGADELDRGGGSDGEGEGEKTQPRGEFWNLVSLSPFFSASCFSGFADAEGGFYAVYDALFASVRAAVTVCCASGAQSVIAWCCPFASSAG
jgi:hypothetical protein